MIPQRVLKILILTHDVSDPATLRRIAHLKAGGSEVAIAGFRRSGTIIRTLDTCAVTDWGRTGNGAFVQRILAVLRTVMTIRTHKCLFANTDVIVARNLEMLAIAVCGRRLAGRNVPVIYEVLDIHRLMLRQDIVGRCLRRLEGWLSASCAAVITSSPAFVENYFHKISRVNLPIRIIENKLVDADINLPPPQEMVPPNAPPWRIGWFGNLRCRKSLTILRDLAQKSDGKIEVIIRGRPSLDQIENFHELVATTPGLKFLGAYQNPHDLATIYGGIDFTWAIDMFEEGLNSKWLLPNRLYEGGYFGAVPLALADVETGRFLQRLGIGVILRQPLEAELFSYLMHVTPEHFLTLKHNVINVPKSAWIYNRSDCADFTMWLRGFVDPQGSFQ